jgi:hypothetical protein
MAEFARKRLRDRQAALMAPHVLMSRVFHRWLHLRVYIMKCVVLCERAPSCV